MTASTRPAAVAGLFYPDNADELRQQVSSMLALAQQEPLFTDAAPPDKTPSAIITPHAGYIYSGSTAAVAWASAARRAAAVTRVVLLGPSHRVAFRGIATSPASQWQSPLGNVSLDQQAAQQLEQLPFVESMATAHAQEHCLEVQVPFMQALFPRAQLLPLVVGDASPAQVAEVLRVFWGDPASLIVISSDLSHYHDYVTAQVLDRATADAIEQGDIERIGPEQACGCQAVNGLLLLAQQHNLHAKTLSLCNSGDVARGDKQRVVGYGAFAIQ